MANVISDETMEYVGILAKLELSKEEQKAARKDMERMLSYRVLREEIRKKSLLQVLPSSDLPVPLLLWPQP